MIVLAETPEQPPEYAGADPSPLATPPDTTTVACCRQDKSRAKRGDGHLEAHVRGRVPIPCPMPSTSFVQHDVDIPRDSGRLHNLYDRPGRATNLNYG